MPGRAWRGGRAGVLAAEVGRQTAPFELDVRKLKGPGLALSLEVGYRLSPRGAAYAGPAPTRRAPKLGIASEPPEGTTVDDREITARISELVDEEHRLERAHVGQALTDDEQARMDALAVELDRCWDLLRQRRARREFGRDPESAEARPGGTVEGYRQ